MAIFFAGCDSARMYETNIDLKEEAWAVNDTLSFKFNVEDPSKKYNLLYNIRYTEDYPYYNLYVRHTLTDTVGNVLQTVNQPQNMDLFQSATGAPHGNGLSDTYDYRILVLQDYSFPHKGEYTMHVKQFMRENPLKGISAFGLRIEDASGATR